MLTGLWFYDSMINDYFILINEGKERMVVERFLKEDIFARNIFVSEIRFYFEEFVFKLLRR